MQTRDGGKLGKAESQDMTDDASPPAPAIGKMLQLAGPELPLLCVTMVSRIAVEGMGLITPLLTGNAFDVVVQALGSSGGGLSADDVGKASQDVAGIMILVLCLHVGSQALTFFNMSITGISGERIVARLRVRLYRHVLAQELGFFDSRKTGELVSRLGSDTQLVQMACSQHLTEVINAILKVLACFGFMFFISWKLTLIIFGTAMVLLLFCGPFGAYVGVLSRRYQDALGKGANCSTEALGSMRTVRAFAGEVKESQRYVERIGDPTAGWLPAAASQQDETTLRVGVLKALAMATFIPSVLLVFFSAMHIILWYGFTLCLEGEISIGRMTAFQGYIFNLGFAIAQAGGNLVALLNARGGAARIFEILDRSPELPESASANAEKFSNSASATGPNAAEGGITGEVAFQNVNFAYPSRPEVNVLANFTLHVPCKTTAAIVGASGGGKSSALAVLSRFYQHSGGRVLIDGQDVASYDIKFLRRHMTLVQQEPVLFGISVRDNVCYGCQQPVADEQVYEACKQANAHSFIADAGSFPDGYLTLVGERGVRLSGGQKQRIAIARALVLQPKILLLDEATSALDSESEHLVQEAIDRVMVGRTVLVVAHRLSTVVDAHQIAMCINGAVHDTGTHQQLLGRCPEYAKLVKRQLGGDKGSAASGLNLLGRNRGSEGSGLDALSDPNPNPDCSASPPFLDTAETTNSGAAAPDRQGSGTAEEVVYGTSC